MFPNDMPADFPEDDFLDMDAGRPSDIELPRRADSLDASNSLFDDRDDGASRGLMPLGYCSVARGSWPRARRPLPP